MVEPLRVGIANAVERLDPHEAIEYAAGMIQLQIFETPYRAEHGDISPHLFSERLTEAAGQWHKWQVRVDTSHVFSDGTPLSAEIVADSLRRSGRLGSNASINAEDDRVVVSDADARLHPDELFASPYSSIVLERDGRLLGTGPYREAADSTPSRFRLEPNPHHIGPPPSVEAIEFVAFESEAAIVSAISAGLIDFTGTLSPRSLGEVRRARTQFLTGPSTALMWFHCDRVRDRRVRAAIAAALDLEALTRCSFADPTAFASTSVVPPALDTFDDGLEQDDERARSLLADAGVELPLKLTLVRIWSPRKYMPGPDATAKLVAEQLATIGVEIDIVETTSPREYLDRITSGDYDLILGGWTADENSVAVFLDALYGSSNVPLADGRLPGCNFARWRDSKTDELLREVHEHGGREPVETLLAHLKNEVPVVALHHGCLALALGERIRGREFDALGYPRFASFTLGRSRR